MEGDDEDLPPLAERRPTPRRRVLLSGLASDPDGHSMAKCQIRDISAKGARVLIARHHKIPSDFLLVTVKDRLVRSAKLIWRKGDELGLVFTDSSPHTLDENSIPPEIAAAVNREQEAFIKWR